MPLLFLAIIFLLTLLAGCSRDVAQSPPPGSEEFRIAVLSPAIAVILRDMDLSDQVVARHGWDMVLDQSLPVAGDQTGLDYEVLLRANPTHVLLEWGARPLPARLEQLAEQHGWVIHNYRLLTLEEIVSTAKSLHEQFVPSEAWEETLLAAQWHAALRKRDGVQRAGRVLLLYSTRPPGALGPGSAHQQVLEAIGAEPALTSGAPFVTLDAEDVLRLAPDAIILIRPRRRDDPVEPQPSVEVLRQQLGRIGTLDIPAVRLGRIGMIDHPLGQIPSTSLIEIADEMAMILTGWAD